MASIASAAKQPDPLSSPATPQKFSDNELSAAPEREKDTHAQQLSETSVEDSNPNVVLVAYEQDDPENPVNWSPIQKWLMVFALSWMGFVSVFATMSIVPTAPQVLQEFHSHSAFDRTLLITIWELGEAVGPFFIAPLSERFGRLPVFHIGNLLALCCLVACALSINIPMLIAFRFLSGCFLSIPTLGPTIVGDLFEEDQMGRSMALVMGTQMVADFTSPLAGAYIAHDLGWRWSVWLAAIVLGFFSLLLLLVLRETYAVVILRRKAKRLQNESRDEKQYRSKHQAHVDGYFIVEVGLRPLQILAKSPILMLTTGYMSVTYGLVSLIIATITEAMESTYPSVFSTGSVGLTFLSLAIGNTVALIFYSFTSDRYVARQRETKGDAFRPESRLVHLLLAAAMLPMGFLLYGWTLEYHVQYIVPLAGSCAAGFSMLLCAITPETYVVDVYKIHGASAIAGGVTFRAIAGAFLPLIGPPLYQTIGLGWGNSVLALIAAVFIPPLGLLMRYGDWFRSKDRFGSSER